MDIKTMDTKNDLPAAFSWPNGNRIAVIVTLLFENWSDGQAPNYSPMTTSLKPGSYDRAGVTWSQYGGNAGIWRLIRILDEFGIKATVCANARSVELYPDAARMAVERGHEIAAHNYTQDGLLAYMSPKEQQETIRRCVKIIEQHTGVRPTGWLSSVLASTDDTVDQLCQEGFLWYGDCNDWDLPRILHAKSGSIVNLPHTDFADNRVLRQHPRPYFDMHKDTFDFLYRNEPGAMLNLTAHCNFGGRPLMAAMFADILRYFRSFPDVWFPRHDEMATWFRGLGVDQVSYADRFFPTASVTAKKSRSSR
jgi:peptidoglycan/xylan/chitin deacetylase (PgdA/CDA1 family)